MCIFSFHIPLAYASVTYEDFENDYIEVDTANDRIQCSGTHIDFVSSKNNEETYVYKDFGVDYFGDFIHNFDARLVSGTWFGCVWGLSNTVDELLDCDPMVVVCFYGSNNLIYLIEYSGGQFDDVSDFTFVDGTWYYFSVIKSGVSLSCEIYSDSDRLNLLDTLSLTLHSDWKFRYAYGCSSWTLSSPGLATLDIENLNLNGLRHWVTLYFNEGGQFRVNNATVTNGTSSYFWNGTVIELCAVTKNESWVFVSFNWSSSSVTNPHNLTITQNETVWLFFRDPPAWKLGEENNIPILFVGACVIGGLICFVFVLAWKRKKR